MALVGHWVAADAGGAGTTLPDRSASGADGTLSGGCTWVTANGEPAVRCPASDAVSVPDHSRWTLGDFTLIVRLMFNSVSGVPAWLSHTEGTGVVAKWVWNYGHGAGASSLHWQTADQTVTGSLWTPSTSVIYALGLVRSGSNFTFYRDLATDGTAVNANAFSDAAAALLLGWGGEGYFDSDVSIISMRVYDAALADQAVFDAMLEDGGSVRTPLSAALSLTGGAPTVENSGEITRTPTAAALALTGAAPGLLEDIRRDPTAGAMAFTGAAPDLLQQILRTPVAGAISVTGAAPTIEGLADFVDRLEFAPLIDGGRFVFTDLVTVLQAPLPVFVDRLVAVAALPVFVDVLRSMPNLDPLFSDDLQRTYAEAELT